MTSSKPPAPLQTSAPMAYANRTSIAMAWAMAVHMTHYKDPVHLLEAVEPPSAELRQLEGDASRSVDTPERFPSRCNTALKT